MVRFFTYYQHWQWQIDDKWKHGEAAIATLGDRMVPGLFAAHDVNNLDDDDFDRLRKEIGRPVTMEEYAKKESYLGKYYFATGRALAGYISKRELTTAAREAATGTCVQFDNLYPAIPGHVPFKDGCRARSEAVNRWMAGNRSADFAASGFSEHDHDDYMNKTRDGYFMLTTPQRDKAVDKGIASTFIRFASVYPGTFVRKFNWAPDSLRKAFSDIIENEARKARESGVKAREKAATKIARDTMFLANSIYYFSHTREPIVARQIVERIVHDVRSEVQSGITMHPHRFAESFSSHINKEENETITNAAIDLVSISKDKTILKMRCDFLSEARNFHGIGDATKQKAEARYDELCGIR